MVRTESNKDLIAEIKAGIKKEGSVGFRASSSICSICGTDNAKSYCPHWPGRSYHKDGGPQVCTFKLDGVKDAYEFSLVAVPAQRAAGVSKSYTGETVYEAQEASESPETENKKTDHGDSEKAKELELRARLAGIHTNT
jgi:phage head maturation protease